MWCVWCRGENDQSVVLSDLSGGHRSEAAAGQSWRCRVHRGQGQCPAHLTSIMCTHTHTHSAVTLTDSVCLQAIRDGVIEASINHEKGYVQSKETMDIYSTREPQLAFHQRISFCLDIHNMSVKVGQTDRTDCFKIVLKQERIVCSVLSPFGWIALLDLIHRLPIISALRELLPELSVTNNWYYIVYHIYIINNDFLKISWACRWIVSIMLFSDTFSSVNFLNFHALLRLKPCERAFYNIHVLNVDLLIWYTWTS